MATAKVKLSAHDVTPNLETESIGSTGACMNFLKSIFGGSQDAVSTADARTLVEEDKTVVVLDVRQPDEFRSGHISGAKLIPLNELPQRLKDVPKDKTILCVCRSGSRSGMAVRQLNAAGYKAINLQGGMMRWQSAGYPVKRGS
jgi:rhodanese-related sulfurtransferase